MRRKDVRKCPADDRRSLFPAISPGDSVPKNRLAGFDLARRSHQAVFWMLLNRAIFEKPHPSNEI